jgi:hypothetical protein
MNNIDFITKSPLFWPALIGGSVLVFAFTSSATAVAVGLILVAVGLYVLMLINKGMLQPVAESMGACPKGADMSHTVSGSELQPVAARLQEVFHVSGNNHTYEDAAATCAVYDAELATYEQLEESYGKGADWSEYGWTMGGMAFYPIQEDTWKRLEQDYDSNKILSRGNPGINGGPFDPKRKFGVNCYGVKPEKQNRNYVSSIALKKQAAGCKAQTAPNNNKKESIAPFNQNNWSMWGMA